MNTPTFSGLPLELQQMVIQLLPKTALKQARLVNKQWNAEAAKVLWSVANINVLRSEHFEDLLAVTSSGILDNVRELCVGLGERDWYDLKTTTRNKALKNVLDLLHALPRDRLSVYRNKVFPSNRDSLGALLRNQMQVKELALCLDGEKSRCLPSVNLLRGNLQQLQTLRLDVCNDSRAIYEQLPIWFQYAPSLLNLQLDYCSTAHVFLGWTAPAQAPLLGLQSLSLCDMRLSDAAGHFSSVIQLPRLQSLEIDSCRNAGSLLQSFASVFKKLGSTSLRSFSFRGSEEDSSNTAIAQLLRSTRGLVRICVIVAERPDMTLPEIRCLGNHGESLRELQWTSNENDLTCSADDLKYLVTVCKTLERLVVRVGDLGQMIEDLSRWQKIALFLSEEYPGALRALAQISTLKRLSLMDLMLRGNPDDDDKIDDDDTALRRQSRYGEAADEVFGCLVEHGSEVEVLDFGHTRNWDDVEVDENGHMWPSYSYRRGSVMTDIRGRQQFVKTVAIPMPVSRDKTRLDF